MEKISSGARWRKNKSEARKKVSAYLNGKEKGEQSRAGAASIASNNKIMQCKHLSAQSAWQKMNERTQRGSGENSETFFLAVFEGRRVVSGNRQFFFYIRFNKL